MQLATFSTSVLALAAAASHMTRERTRARVLLTALLDRLPDLRPEVMHVPHRHVSRDEGEDGLAEGEQQRRRREQRVGPHVHQEVGGGGTACGGGGRRYGSGERAGARSSMLCSGESEP